MTLSNRKMLHNFNSRIVQKKIEVPIYQLEDSGDSDFQGELLVSIGAFLGLLLGAFLLSFLF